MHNFLKKKDDVSVIYDARLMICKNGFVKAKKYRKPLEKIKDGYESIEVKNGSKIPSKQKTKKASEKEKEIERRSLTRTRDNLIAYASENEDLWKSFLTLTFAENVKDLTQANKKFEYWVMSMKRKKPDFAYLAVPEFQKRGAVHYHLLSNLECGSDIPAKEPIKTWNKEKKKYYEIYFYDVPFWNNGFSSAEDLKSFDDKFNCALYITKYLFKDIDNRLWGRKKIMKSNNLKKPMNYYLDSETFKNAMDYIKKCGYQMSVYDFEPVQRYLIPHTAYTVKENLSNDDYNIVKKIMSGAYQEPMK